MTAATSSCDLLNGGANCPPAPLPPYAPRAPIELARWQVWRFERGTRYYRLHLEQDLWGVWCLTRVYGRRASALGAVRCAPLASPGVADTMIAAALVRRRRRGYQLLTDST
jgi:hypothetical protein